MSQAVGVKGETLVVEPTRAQRAIGRRSAESRATVPSVELCLEADMSVALGLPAEVDAILVRACALALVEVPEANATYRDGRFERHGRVNIAVLLDADGAHVPATVFDADRKSLQELQDELAALTERAGELAAPEMAGATFTLSNPGRHGVGSASPIVTPGQAAALAAGAIREAPVVRNTGIVPGRLMTLVLAADHRILFEAQAARFLSAARARIEAGSL